VTPSSAERPGGARLRIRMRARLDATTRANVDEPARRVHRPRARCCDTSCAGASGTPRPTHETPTTSTAPSTTSGSHGSGGGGRPRRVDAGAAAAPSERRRGQDRRTCRQAHGSVLPMADALMEEAESDREARQPARHIRAGGWRAPGRHRAPGPPAGPGPTGVLPRSPPLRARGLPAPSGSGPCPLRA
jgi:hypothetical protein